MEKRLVPKIAYQMEEKNGGYQLYKITLNDNNELVNRERISDPDGWDYIILLLEQELSKQFA